MELRQIEYVIGVEDHGGFTSAARSLHVTQPALSEGIARLEAELGVLLFHRVGRRAVLSAAGAAFLEPARHLLRDRTVLTASVAAVAGLDAGTLDVVALPTLAVDPLAAIVGAFRRAHPRVAVRIAQPEDATGVADRVRSGQSEIGLAELPIAGRDLVSEPLVEQVLVVVLAADSPLARRRRLTIRDLASVPLIATPPGTSMRNLLDDAFRTAGLTPDIAVETEQREAIVPLVQSGAGASVLPRRVAQSARASGVVGIPLSPVLRRSIGLVWRSGPVSPAAQAFIALGRDGSASSDLDDERLPRTAVR
jgi:DNA-binding transcriptional LysR family regulator